jgi:hypothetical protein
MAGVLDEHIFQAGFGDGDGDDFAGEGLDYLGEEAMALLAFDANSVADDNGRDGEAVCNPRA